MNRLLTLKDAALTVQEIAQLANVSEDTVRTWIASKKLPAAKFPGSKKQSIYRVLREDWDRFVRISKA